MNQEISLVEAKATRKLGADVPEDARDLNSFVLNMGHKTPFSTGLLPPGLFSYRQGGGYSQIILQVPPAKSIIIWGSHEHDPNAKYYELAQPYRIIIAELRNGNLLGARTFYSPEFITSWDSVLYADNLPNINLMSYGGTGIGWNCLYHTQDWSKLSVAEVCQAIFIRASGQEAYNDENMGHIDGRRFYEQQRPKQKFLWNAAAWEKKSDKEGIDWVTDPDIWVPLRVRGIDDQLEYVDGGELLTLYMASHGNAPFYYRDRDFPRIYNAIERGLDIPSPRVWDEILAPAFAVTLQKPARKTTKKKASA